MEKNQRWRELCAQAAIEQDPKRLMELVAEISRLFDEEHANRKSFEAGDNSETS
jgi:hypothetical protein